MKIYNSLHNKIEEFVPIEEGKVSMYVCGPTVYNYSHIGNARPIVVFDTLRNILEASGYTVKMVSNYTDVDDKIINAAKELSVKEADITAKFMEAYHDDREGLHAKEPDVAPRVTETMSEIIAFIELLIKEGYAYAVDGDVYFRVGKVEDYGKLSNQKRDDLQVGARIHENQMKENPLDFTLWKKTSEGIKWDSPWSKGRPGWHTECVVMIQKEFHTNLIDIHGGGMDLKFPHHENEIAQAHACGHTSLANYWVHNGMVNIDGEKMSKSLGNVIWTKDLLALYGGNTLRFAMLSAHYRAPLNMSEESLLQAQKEVQKIETLCKQMDVKIQLQGGEFLEDVEDELYDRFLLELQQDMNTPNAISVLYETMKKANALVRAKEGLDELIRLRATLQKMLDVLGILSERTVLSSTDISLYKAWNEAKTAKDFVKADELRAQLIELGVL